MSLFSKVSKIIPQETQKLANRFIGNGFMPMGAVTRQPRANTVQEITGSIRAYAKENPEIAEFAQQMKDMNPEHFGLAHDVIDLSRTQEMINTYINLNEKTVMGKTIAGWILSRLPEVSRKNPAALDLIQAVINHSDTQNAKYFLIKMFGFDLAKMNGLSEQMKAVKEVVPAIAEDTLSGGYTMDFSKNSEFFSYIQHLCSGDSKPENIKMLKQIHEMINKLCKKTSPVCNIDDIRIGDTAVIKRNMDALPYLLENAEAQGKSVDMSAFLTRNVNLD